MELQLKIIGFLLIVLAIAHVIFPKYFDWKSQLSTLSLMNREMMYIHTFFIAFTVLLMGILCITSSPELVMTHLGNKICLGLGIFWGTRFLIQFHVLFSLLWGYLTFIFLKIGI
jgi:hypothetical protein